MSTKISSCRHELQNNFDKFSPRPYNLEGRFTKRIHGLQRFIPKAHLRDTYLAMQETMSLQTRVSFTAIRVLADRRGVEMRTLRRHLAELARLGVVQVTRRKYACRSNHTNRYTFPLLNEDFLRVNLLSRGGGVRVRVKPLPEMEKQTTTPPTPSARRTERTWQPDPKQKPPAGDGLRFTHWTRWREHCKARHEEQRTHMAMQARVGVNTAPIQPMSEAERLEYQEEIRLLDAKRAARLAHGGMMEAR